MIIRKVHKENALIKKIRFLTVQPQPIRTLLLLAVSIVLILLIIMASIFFGIVLCKTGFAHDVSGLLKMPARERFAIVPNYFRGLKAMPDCIAIDIGYKDFQKLAYKRKVAFAKKALFCDSDDYVPAKISYNDKIVKAKIRLKGDWLDHLEG